MTDELKSFRKKAEWLRESAALLSGLASTIDRFVLAVELGDGEQAAIQSEALHAMRPKLENIQMGGDIFRFELKL